MLLEEIKVLSKEKKINIFFDMDGTIVELDADAEGLRAKKGSNYFVNKRPIKTIINQINELSKNKNISLHILSNCCLEEQISQKRQWLKRYAPIFKDENIHIICLENIKYTSEQKPFLKGNKIKELIKDNSLSYLIEDDHKVINASNQFGNIKAYHVSHLIE